MKHKIVIVGGGAGGLELATKLGKRFGKSDKASITLVDTNLTHVWKPLLHEVAAGALSSATEELNYHAQAKWNHFSFELGTMEGLDRKAKTLSLAAVMDEDDKPLIAPRTLCYDTLIVAVGSNSNEFGCAIHAIRPPSPPTSGHLFHAHPAGQSERSDAGLHC